MLDKLPSVFRVAEYAAVFQYPQKIIKPHQDGTDTASFNIFLEGFNLLLKHL